MDNPTSSVQWFPLALLAVVLCLLAAAALWLLVRALQTGRQIEELLARQGRVERDLAQIKARLEPPPAPTLVAKPAAPASLPARAEDTRVIVSAQLEELRRRQMASEQTAFLPAPPRMPGPAAPPSKPAPPPPPSPPPARP